MFILKKVNSLKQSITIHLVAQDSNRSMPIMIIFQSFDIPPATSSYLSKVNQLSPRKVPAPPKHAWLDRILVGIVQLLVQVQVPNVSIYTVSRCPESFHLVIVHCTCQPSHKQFIGKECSGNMKWVSTVSRYIGNKLTLRLGLPEVLKTNELFLNHLSD